MMAPYYLRSIKYYRQKFSVSNLVLLSTIKNPDVNIKIDSNKGNNVNIFVNNTVGNEVKTANLFNLILNNATDIDEHN